MSVSELLARFGLGESRQMQVTAGRMQAFAHLRATAELHHGETGDAQRRSALNRAADAIRDGREPGR